MNTSLDNLTHKMQRAALGKIVDVALSRAEQDREKTMCQLVDAAKQFYGSGFSDETYENAKKVLTDPNSKWTKLINCVLDQTDPHVARTTALNLGYEAFFRGTKMIRENRVKYQCNIPWLILFDPTSACNMHCVGCWAGEYGHKNNLSFEDMDKIVTQGKELGVYLYMLTGGEPLVRRGIVELCAMLRAVPGIEELCLTTNGTRLEQLAAPLKAAGVDRLNISLDTLRPERYREITRTGELENVLRGIEAAERAGFENIKLNCVLLGGMNDDEIGDFVRLTAKKPWQVRFIELMPMGVCAAWPPERFLPAQEVLSRVPELRPAGRSGVAQLYRLPGAAGTVGLIEPMSCAFCADCTRIRITADGKLKPCLHSDAELALRGLSGAELEAAIRRGILMKPARHRMDETGVTETHRGMFAIGG